MTIEQQATQMSPKRPPTYEDDHWITLRRSECERILLFCWPFLSEPTQQSLRSIGIDPETAAAFGTPPPTAPGLEPRQSNNLNSPNKS